MDMASTNFLGKDSSALLQKILDTTQTMIFWKDEQRRFVGVNQAFLDYYGFPGQEVLLGKTDEEMGWHSDSEAFENDEWQVLRQGKSFSMVHGKCMARGEEREILASKSPLYEQGKIVGLVGSFIDVTEQYRKQDEIASLTRKLDGIPGGIAIFKRHYKELRCISVNKCLERLLGVSASALVGQSVREIAAACVLPQDRERWVWENMQLHGQSKSVSGTYRFYNQTADKIIWLHMDCRLVREPGDEELVYCTYTNVNRLMQDEEELEGTRRQEEERYARAQELLRQEQEENIVVKGHYNFTRNLVLEYTAFLDQVYKTTKGTSFDDAFAGLMQLSYTEADRERLAATLNRGHILESFARGEMHLKVSYRRLLNGTEPIWLLLVMQTFKSPSTGDVEGISYTYDITEKVLKENIVNKLGGLGYDELGIVYLQNGFWRCYQFRNYLRREPHLVTNKGPWDVEIERYVREDVVPEQRQRVLAELRLPAIVQQLTKRDVYTFTNSVRLQDGSLRQEQLQFSYQDRETLFYCMSDITVQFIHENAQLADLAAAKLAADKANQSKSNFLSSMSHDLRTPLNGIIGFTNLALQAKDVEAKQDFLHKIKSSGELLEDLVNDTLELSRIESGKQILEPETVTEKDFWEEVVTAMIPSAQMKNIQLQAEKTLPVDELISLDRVKAKRILLNLISNAIKYTPQGGRIKVAISALEPPEHGCSRRLVIEDTGIGMTPGFLARMYEPFSQEHRPEAGNVTGTGLGLAIVKMNVDLMGGTIRAVSKVGVGTRFTVDLPVEHWPRTEAQETLAAVRKSELDLQRLAGWKVLLCEDNYLNAEIATLLLKDKQMEVDWARDGQQGLLKFRDSLPGYYDIILMDIRMPVLDGYKTTRAIRKLTRTDAATVPVIAMTANAFEEDLREATAAGMDAYITKPVNPEHLYRTLLEAKKG